MSLETIAARYATALYEIGVEQNNLAQVTDEVKRIADTYAESDDLRAVLDNPLVDDAARLAMLKELGERLNLSPIVKNTVGYLAGKHRLSLLPYVSRSLAKQADENSGVVRAKVTSAAPLSEAQFSKLKTELEASTGKKVVLDRAVDPELLGGLVTRIGDRIIDGSVRSRLESLEQKLLA